MLERLQEILIFLFVYLMEPEAFLWETFEDEMLIRSQLTTSLLNDSTYFKGKFYFPA